MTDALRILFADDEETFLYSTADLLRREGFECDCVPNAIVARERLQQAAYDLVIADIKMPGNPDLEFARFLAELTPAPPIILVTGHPSLNSAVQSIELPVVAYLVKPFDFNDLLAKVRAVDQNVAIQRAVANELARLMEYRRSLMHVSERTWQQPRLTPGQSLQAFVGAALRNLVDSVAELNKTVTVIEGSKSVADESSRHEVPSELRQVLHDAVSTLERTKGAFKSKELGELRKKLAGLLKT